MEADRCSRPACGADGLPVGGAGLRAQGAFLDLSPHGHLRFPGIPARDEWELRNRVFTPAEVAALDNHEAAGNPKRSP
jgi:hypothetical protein